MPTITTRDGRKIHVDFADKIKDLEDVYCGRRWPIEHAKPDELNAEGTQNDRRDPHVTIEPEELKCEN